MSKLQRKNIEEPRETSICIQIQKLESIYSHDSCDDKPATNNEDDKLMTDSQFNESLSPN